ncbi:MAG: H-X9-DG-CTERM domain-containing protein [Armatimonadota bacterium]
MQDHDETFPDATTWVTELASTYGVTGKVWDCPTTSFKGTEAAPDYFFLGGSFLSSAALGDVKSPDAAPLLLELASPKSNNPYVVHGDYDMIANALALTDKARHNNGALIAYVDGHVAWLSASLFNASTLIPSIVSGSLKYPQDLGDIGTISETAHPNNLAYKSIHDQISTLGFTYIVGSTNGTGTGLPRTQNLTTNADNKTLLPTWLDQDKTLTEYADDTTSQVVGKYFSVKWGTHATTLWAIDGLNYTAFGGGSSDLTKSFDLRIVPNTTGVKKVAIVAERGYAGDGILYVDSITTKRPSDAAPVDTGVPAAAIDVGSGVGSMGAVKVHAYLLPVEKDQSIIFNIRVTRANTTACIGPLIIFEE